MTRSVTSEHDIFDRALLVRRRDRVAADAGRHDFLLARVADDLIERLAAIQRRFPVALNLGAYHGLLGRRLRQVPGVEMVIDAEAAPRLLAQCEGPRVRADEEALPFRDQSLDLVVSGLSLQLVNDLPGTLVQIRRALKPDGLLLAALLGGNTLVELRTAFSPPRRKWKAAPARALPPLPKCRTWARCCSGPGSRCPWSTPIRSPPPIPMRLP